MGLRGLESRVVVAQVDRTIKARNHRCLCSSFLGVSVMSRILTYAPFPILM